MTQDSLAESPIAGQKCAETAASNCSQHHIFLPFSTNRVLDGNHAAEHGVHGPGRERIHVEDVIRQC